MRTADAAIADRLPGLAAEIAFWVLLSLPALLVAGIATLGLIGDLEGAGWQDQLIERVIEVARVALTADTIDSIVEPVLRQLFEETNPGLVSVAFLTAVWTASRAVKVVLSTTAIVYDRLDLRRPWQDRLLGFGLTVGGLVVGAVLAPLLVSGPDFAMTLERWTGTDLSPFTELWSVAYWPTVVLLATLALASLYHLAIPGRTRWRDDLPGAVLATAVWLAGSAGLRIYGSFTAEGSSAYGPLAGPIVGLLWLWVTGFAVLLGGEFNAQIHKERQEDPRAPDDGPDEAPPDHRHQETRAAEPSGG